MKLKELKELRRLHLLSKKPYWPKGLDWDKRLNELEIAIAKAKAKN